MRSIDFAEFLDRHDPFKKPVLPQPGMPDAGAFALLRGAQNEVSAPGHIEVPRNETELVRFGVEVEIKVLAIGEQTVVAAKQHLDRQKTRKLVEIKELPNMS